MTYSFTSATADEVDQYTPIGYVSDTGIRVFRDRNNPDCCGCQKCARLCYGCSKCDPDNKKGNLHDPRD